MNETKIKINGFNPNINVGIVGYGSIDALNEIKDFFSTLEDFHIVYIKTSGQRLWIKEGAQ